MQDFFIVALGLISIVIFTGFIFKFQSDVVDRDRF
jgi:hypothetical protein